MSLDSRAFARFSYDFAKFTAPFTLLALSYFWLDPFMVLRSYQSYQPPMIDGHYVHLNADSFGTETFLRNRSTIDYRTFILGNSRLAGFQAHDLGRLVGDPMPFSYGASGESLFGVLGKLRLLVRLNQRIDQVLWVVDSSLLRQTNNRFPGHVYIKDPRVSGESWLAFHAMFFKAYLSDLFMIKYLDLRLTGRYKRYMGNVFASKRITLDPQTNSTMPGAEELIQRDPEAYYAGMKNVFYFRPQPRNQDVPVVKSVQLQMLQEIREIFAAKGTRFDLVVSPLYDQIAINREDLSQLQRIFGAERVHDYSGVNRYTLPVTNYYETSHYRPQVGRAIMSEIYSGRPARRELGSDTRSGDQNWK